MNPAHAAPCPPAGAQHYAALALLVLALLGSALLACGVPATAERAAGRERTVAVSVHALLRGLPNPDQARAAAKNG